MSGERGKAVASGPAPEGMDERQQRIFRRVSLQRLSSPEQLDQVMQVTTLRGWIALAGLGVLLLSAGAWSLTGTVSDKVGGSGILIRSGGVLEVVATSAGRVIDVAVEVGDNVAEGQTVARLAQPDLFDRLQAAKRRLQLMRRQQEQALAFLDGQDRLQRQALRQQRENLDKSIAAAEDDQRILAARVANQQELLKDGLITQSALLATRQQYEQQKERIRQARADQAQLQLRQVSLEDERAKMMRAGESDMQQAADEVARLEREFAFATEIVSPYTGRILEIMGEAGSIVGQGEPLLTLHLTGQSVQDLLAIIYVPAAFGKIIRPGMQIQVSPATVRKEEYGFMLGTVTFVSDYPATQKGMLRVLKNPQLIQALSGGGAPYEVHATLLVDPRTPSHYRWSSSSGPPMRIGSGTLAAAEVMVHEQRPIALVIPILRRWTGF